MGKIILGIVAAAAALYLVTDNIVLPIVVITILGGLVTHSLYVDRRDNNRDVAELKYWGRRVAPILIFAQTPDDPTVELRLNHYKDLLDRSGNKAFDQDKDFIVHYYDGFIDGKPTIGMTDFDRDMLTIRLWESKLNECKERYYKDRAARNVQGEHIYGQAKNVDQLKDTGYGAFFKK